MTSIILGIFQGNFRSMMYKTNSCSYPFTELIGDKFMDFGGDEDAVVNTVYFAARQATVINFLIDNIQPEGILEPNNKSITCRELRILLSHHNDDIKNKIIFWEDGEVVKDEYARVKLNIPKHIFY